MAKSKAKQLDNYFISVRIDSCKFPTRISKFHAMDWNNGNNKKDLLKALQVGLKRLDEQSQLLN